MTLFARRGTCRSCGQALVPAPAAIVHGEDLDVAVAITGFPVVRCPDGHRTRRHPTEPLPPLYEAAFAAVTHHADPGCAGDPDDGEVVEGARWDVTWPHEVGPVTVTVTARAGRCPSCAAVVAGPRSYVANEGLPEAMARALRAGEIR